MMAPEPDITSEEITKASDGLYSSKVRNSIRKLGKFAKSKYDYNLQEV